MQKKPLVVVAGATASGKTALAVELCRRLGGEIVSADSMQIYRGMPIATAAPSAEELAAARHHLVGILEVGETFSVADWAALARETVSELHERGVLPIAAGGTGLYLSALMDGTAFESFPGDTALRTQLERRAREEGGAVLHEELRRLDPVLAQRLHPNNVGRVIRALEVTLSTGTPMSEHQRRASAGDGDYTVCALALGFRDRAAMWERIDRRVDAMLEAGLVEEARAVRERGAGRTAAAAIGYKELLPYLRGECTLPEAVSLIKLRTRQYAKRQLTWLRRDERYRWLWVDEFASPAALADEAERLIRESEAGKIHLSTNFCRPEGQSVV